MARGRVAHLPLLLGIVAGTFLNEGFSLLRAGDGLERPLALLQDLSATAAVIAAVVTLVWLVLSQTLTRIVGVSREALAWGTAAGIAALAALLPFAGMTEGAVATGLRAVAALGGIGAAVLCGLASRQPGRADVPGILAIVVISLGPPSLALVWLLSSHGVSSASTSDPRLSRGIALALLVVAAAVLLVAARALKRRIGAGGLTASTVGLLLILGPVAYAVDARGPSAAPSAARTERSSLLLITIDTLRSDHLGAYGAAPDLTPNIDRLAKDSLVFRNARSPAPWTKPAMASVLTGLPPAVHGMLGRGTRLPKEVETLAGRLAKAGFSTVALGRNGYLSRRSGFDRGFRHFEMASGAEPRPHPSAGAQLLRALDLAPRPPTTDELATRAIRWIDALEGAQPFFLWVHFFDPHLPYAPPKPYLPAGDASGMTSFAGHMSFRSGHLRLSDDERAAVRRLYAAEVRYVDEAVGRILDRLRRSGLYDRMGIVLTSDHGEELFEHGGIEHGHTLYDEVLRVPLLVKTPGQLQGRDLDQAVSTESVTRTLMEVSGLGWDPAEPSMPSLLSVAAGDGAPPTISTGLLYYDELVGVVFDGVKYIRRLRDGWEQLFVLGTDADEHHEVSDPSLLATARGILEAYDASAVKTRQQMHLTQPQELDLDEKEMQDLRNLGYVR